LLVRVATAMVALSACAASVTPLHAQGAVRGQVRVVERSGASRADLRDAVIYLESDASLPRAASLEDASVAMRLREFEPHVQVVAVGGTVSYPNQDPFSHNVFSNSSLGAFDLGLYRTGKSRSATFTRPGVYAIYCNIHARMVNYVIAVRTPHVTRANAAGTFVVDKVPAGTWRLHVWHERAPEHIERVEVPASGLANLVIALDGRGFVAKPHSNKFGQPYATTRADRY
jgi:plastocyanin